MRKVIEYTPKGCEVPEGMERIGWINRDLYEEWAAGVEDVEFPRLWAHESFHAQVPVFAPLEADDE